MNSNRINRWKLFWVPLLVFLAGVIPVGCSDDNEELSENQYGYVQFKLYKSASYEEGTNQPEAPDTRAQLDKLSDAQKVEIEMLYNGMSIIQTLVLNAYNETNAEYGMRSDKLKMLTGDYRIVSYKLYDKLDNVITSIAADESETFTVVSRGLTVKDLLVDAKERGSLTFKLEKTGLGTRAQGAYLFSSIKVIDVTVVNTFTHTPIEFKDLKVTYKEESVENQNPDDADDKYMEIGTHGVTLLYGYLPESIG